MTSNVIKVVFVNNVYGPISYYVIQYYIYKYIYMQYGGKFKLKVSRRRLGLCYLKGSSFLTFPEIIIQMTTLLIKI